MRSAAALKCVPPQRCKEKVAIDRGARLKPSRGRAKRRRGTRVIQIATDRPVSFEEAFERRGQWTWNFNVTFIEMIVDDEGRGEGTLAAGVEFRYDEEHDTLTMARVSSEPVRLNQITMRIEQ